MDIKEKLIRKLRSPGFTDHKLTLTRRELIRLGLIAGGGYLFPFPGVGSAAVAAEDKKTHIPFLVLDLAGGAAMPGNFLVGQAGGPEDLFANYTRVGWNPRASGALNKTFGLPMSAKNSQMLAGMLETLPPELAREDQRNFKMSSFAHFSLSDTNTNRASAVTMVSKAGAVGRFIRAGLGMQASNSGGNSDVYLTDPKFRPKAVGSISDVMNLTLFNSEFSDLDPKTRKEIFARLGEAAGDDQALREAYASIADLGVLEPRMDVRNHAEVARIYGLGSSGSAVAGNALEAAIVFNVLNGYTGPGVITVPNCDYHDNTGTTGDRIDREIGNRIGRAVAAAKALNKPLMIQIITDGGIYAPGSESFERRWVGDDNQLSLTVLAYYNPAGPVNQRKLQVGHYTAGGQVEQATLVGSKPEKMALAVLVNYLTLIGKLDRFESVANARLQANEIEDFTVFA